MVTEALQEGVVGNDCIGIDIDWSLSRFDDIDPLNISKIFKLRQDVFIVEQDVPYNDIDGKDPYCFHLSGFRENELLAYMRIVPVDLFEKGYWSMGRVVTKIDARGIGLGRITVKKGMDYLEKIRKAQPIKISSQLYLENFYRSFGFEAIGEPYIEDRIPHVAMVKN